MLLLALASGKSQTDAAAEAGVNRRTVYAKLQDPEFRARRDAIVRERVQQAGRILADASTAAAQVLMELLGEKHDAKVRLAAAKEILDKSFGVVEVDALRRQVEDALKAREGGTA